MKRYILLFLVTLLSIFLIDQYIKEIFVDGYYLSGELYRFNSTIIIEA